MTLLLQKRFGWNVAKQNRKCRIRTLCIFKLLFTACSTREAISFFLPRSSWNYKNKLLFQNKNSSIRTLNISKLLYSRCSGKDEITLVLSRSTWNFKKSDFYIWLSLWVNSCKSKKNKNSTQFEIVHTGCSTKEAISLLLLRST